MTLRSMNGLDRRKMRPETELSKSSQRLPAVARRVDGAVRNRLVDIEIPVADLEIEPAVGVGANPGLVVDGSALAAEI